jgi:(p)ppGpp synthase/HD superfamily hydrolase
VTHKEPNLKGELHAVYVFARDAHKDDKRKYTGEPYIVHPIEVMELYKAAVMHIVPTLEGDDAALIPYYTATLKRAQKAALLHDTVEDTSATFTEIEKAFGHLTATDVWWLTDDVMPNKGNRDMRKRIAAIKISRAPRVIQCVKLCDNLSNLSSIAKHDPKFALTYAKEKLASTDAIWNSALNKSDPVLHYLIREVQSLIIHILANPKR